MRKQAEETNFAYRWNGSPWKLIDEGRISLWLRRPKTFVHVKLKGETGDDAGEKRPDHQQKQAHDGNNLVNQGDCQKQLKSL